VRRHRLARPASAPADDEHDGEGGGAGVDVDDGAAGEVERPPPGEPARGAEHPVGHGGIDGHQPQPEEGHVAAEAEAVSRGAGDERRRDDGEHHLVGGEGKAGDGEGLEAGHAVGHDVAEAH